VFQYKRTILSYNYANNYTLRICEETLFADPHAYYFTKNFYLVNEINELISNLHSAGLIERVVLAYDRAISVNTFEKQATPSALTYDNMEGFFDLFYYGLSFAFVSFIMETIFGFFKRKQKKIAHSTKF